MLKWISTTRLGAKRVSYHTEQSECRPHVIILVRLRMSKAVCYVSISTSKDFKYISEEA